jgi:hypothetical protein
MTGLEGRFQIAIYDFRLILSAAKKVAGFNLQSNLQSCSRPDYNPPCNAEHLPKFRRFSAKPPGKKGKKFSLSGPPRVNAFSLRKGGNQRHKLQ